MCFCLGLDERRLGVCLGFLREKRRRRHSQLPSLLWAYTPPPTFKRHIHMHQITSPTTLPRHPNSYGTFLKRGADAVVAAVDARVARWVQIPEAHGEDMQV